MQITRRVLRKCFFADNLEIPHFPGREKPREGKPPVEKKVLQGAKGPAKPLIVEMLWQVEEADPKSIQAKMSCLIGLAGMGLSIVDHTPRELLYVGFSDIFVDFRASQDRTCVGFSIGKCQIDNTIPEARFKTVLAQKPMPRGTAKKFLNCSVRLANYPGAENLLVIEYLSVLLQELEVHVEMALIQNLIGFGEKFKIETGEQLPQNKDKEQDLVMDRYALLSDDAPSFLTVSLGHFLLQPMVIRLVTKLQGFSEWIKEKGWVSNPLVRTLTLIIENFLTNINATLNFSAISLDHACGGMDVLTNPIIAKYTNEAMKQWYKIVFGLEVAGNPAELFGGLAGSVKMLVYDPFQGDVADPKALATGIGRGAVGFTTGAAGAILNFGGNLVSGVGGAVVGMGTSEQYQRERDKRLEEQKESGNVVTNVASNVLGGAWNGVTGLVTDTYQGARDGGVTGFVTGLATGAVGVVTKTAGGVLDGGAAVIQGVQGAGDAIVGNDNKPVKATRLREARFIARDKPMAAYDINEALAQRCLWNLGTEGLDLHQKALKHEDQLALRAGEHIIMEQIEIGDGIDNEKVGDEYTENTFMVIGSNLRLAVRRFKGVRIFNQNDKDQGYNFTDLGGVQQVLEAWWGPKLIVDDEHRASHNDDEKEAPPSFHDFMNSHLAGDKCWEVTLEVAEMLDTDKHILKMGELGRQDTDKSDAESRNRVLQKFKDPCVGTEKALRVTYLRGSRFDGARSGDDKKEPDEFVISARQLDSVGLPERGKKDHVVVRGKEYRETGGHFGIGSSQHLLEDIKRRIQCENNDEARMLETVLKNYIGKLQPTVMTAKYGAGSTWCDVTGILQYYLEKRETATLQNNPQYNKIFGVDPVVGVCKQLIVKYSILTHVKTQVFRERTPIILQ